MADDKQSQQQGALTTRDLKELGIESSQLDSYATRGFQDFLVTLPDEPDFPFELVHDLTPALPSGVRYEVLQSTHPVTLYHHPGDLCLPGIFTLRATSSKLNVRIRLTVDDGDATPLLEPVVDNLDEQLVSFPYKVQAKTPSTDVVMPGATAELDASLDGGASSDAAGPALALRPFPATAGWNWWIVADGSGSGTIHKRLVFVNDHASDATGFGMQLTRDLAGTADAFYVAPDEGGKLYLGAKGAIGSGSGSQYRIENIYTKDLDSTAGFLERGRTTRLGEWQSYTPTWTNLSVGDGTVFASYTLIGKTVHFRVTLIFGSTTSVTGRIRLTLPQTSASNETQHKKSAIAWDQSADQYHPVEALFVSTTLVDIFYATYPWTNTSATAPFTWTTSDRLMIHGTYEMA